MGEEPEGTSPASAVFRSAAERIGFSTTDTLNIRCPRPRMRRTDEGSYFRVVLDLLTKVLDVLRQSVEVFR